MTAGRDCSRRRSGSRATRWCSSTSSAGSVDANGAYLRLLGYGREEILGQPIYRFVAHGPLASPEQWAAALDDGPLHRCGRARLRGRRRRSRPVGGLHGGRDRPPAGPLRGADDLTLGAAFPAHRDRRAACADADPARARDRAAGRAREHRAGDRGRARHRARHAFARTCAMPWTSSAPVRGPIRREGSARGSVLLPWAIGLPRGRSGLELQPARIFAFCAANSSSVRMP